MKLTDFGSAKMTTQEPNFKVCTPEYMAPEMCRALLKSLNLFKGDTKDFPVTCKADVYLLGLVALFMLEKTHHQLKYPTERPDISFIHDYDSLRRDIIKTVFVLIFIRKI